MHVLYVEDNEMNQALVGRVMRGRKHAITFREDGESALDMLAGDAAIDLVLLDIELAGSMDGLDVVKILRDRGDMRPVVAVTAYAMMGDRERIMEAGCDQYLPKPLAIPDLIALLDHYAGEIAKPADAPAATAADKAAPETASETVPAPAPAAETPVAAAVPILVETAPAAVAAPAVPVPVPSNGAAPAHSPEAKTALPGQEAAASPGATTP